MKLTNRTWKHTPQGIEAIWVNPEISDAVFDRLMQWAVANVQGLIEAKQKPGQNAESVLAAYESWNELWADLQKTYPTDTDQGEAIAGFFGIVRDNPEIIAWVIAASRTELVGAR